MNDEARTGQRMVGSKHMMRNDFFSLTPKLPIFLLVLK